MTEAEWLVCTKPVSMLRLLGPRMTARKGRLLACACYRERGWDQGCEPPYRNAVAVAEKYADGLADNIALFASKPRLESARGGEPRFGPGARWPMPEDETTIVIYWRNLAARDLTSEQMGLVENGAVYAAGMEAGREPRREHARFVRCVFGNPFRPTTLEHSWLTSTVLTLASGIYAERAFDRLPILADALQDAGCENIDILSHCRSEGPHVRGCWVVDLLLDKN